MTDHSHQHHAAPAHGRAPDRAPPAVGVTDGAIDPVCGMTVDPHKTAHRHGHAGRTYYFCSAGCRTKFAAHPNKYLAAGGAA